MKHFDKIIGYEAEKKELEKICDILINKDKYAKFGVSFQQGLLLCGEPGVGKSLMAKCLIKATKRNNYVLRKDKPNGDFINEIRNTFDKAIKNAPSIVLLDDLDKFANEDELRRDAEEYVTIQTWIDNIKSSDKEVFVVATANNVRKIPNSLLRSGRFSKRIEVKNPKGKTAEKIMDYYLRQKQNIGDVNIKEIARLLNGKSCADLEAVVNEASIIAAYENKEKVEHQDLVRASLRIIYDAPEACDDEIDDLLFAQRLQAKKKVACHEAGHVIVAELLEPESVTLASIARYNGNRAGITSYYQDETYWSSINSMQNRVKTLLAGKAATEVVFGEIDVGADSDLSRAHNIVLRIVDCYCAYGFDSFVRPLQSPYAIENCAHKTRLEIEKYYQEVKSMIMKNREFLDKVINAFLQKTTLLLSDIQEIKKNCKIKEGV